MRYGILGSTEMWQPDGRRVTIGGPRLRALLARLLVDAGQVVGADRLVEDLYGPQPPRGVTNALQSQVSRLRQALPGGVVEFHPAGYRLAVDPDEVDAHRFLRLAADGHRALGAGDQPRAVKLLTEALALWRGPPLADVPEAPFTPAQVARLEELRLAAVEDRVEAELPVGDHRRLVTELRDLVAAYPLRERLRGLLMRALSADGRQAEALAVYADARRVFADELGTDPSAALAAIHVAVLRGEEVSPRRAVSGGVPAELTSFVGREEEIRRVDRMLGEARLITLTGPGGAGKTRLAVEAAARQTGEVHFVELAPVDEGADVPQAVLSALGLRDAGLREPIARRHDPPGRLVAALADRPVLLVLDNCEHVVSDAARLVNRLLRGCPALRVLATSREALGLTGEALCPLSGLALPPPQATLDATRASPAVRLFVARGASVRPGFTVDKDNADSVRHICRTLDGLPLAIELAAARLRSLPVDQIAARLDDRFALLSRGSRTAQPRHQTLRAVVEWSWDLLDAAEQALARRLTVFAGNGATLDAIARVTGSPAGETLDVLTGLVDKSLVEAGGGRYRMLETIRVFCGEKLVEAGETDRMRRAHLAHFLDVAATTDPRLRGPEQLEWLARLDAERENLHAALRRAIGSGDSEPALRLVSALSFYWWLRGARGEGAALAAELLGTLDGPPPGLAEEYLLCWLIASLGGMGPAPGVESPALALDGPPRQPFVFFLSGMVTGPPGDYPALVERLKHILIDDPWAGALAPAGLGMVALLAGETDRAEAELTAAVEGFRALGERWGSMVAQAALAEAVDLRGDRARAKALLAEALALADQLGSTVDMADLLRSRGDSAARAGDLDDAGVDHERALALARRAGAPELVAAARHGLSNVARLRGELAPARRLAEQALAECPAGWFGADGMRSEILVTLGRIAAAQGDAEAARRRYREALAGPVRLPPTVAAATEGLAALDR